MVKEIPKGRINCKECLDKRKEERWRKYKNEVMEHPQDRLYLIALPVVGEYVGKSYVNAMVYPDRLYGGISGLELIKLYLSKHDKQGKPPDTQAKRMYKFRHKERWGGEAKSVYELEILTGKGNVLNDKTFEKFNETLSGIDKNEKLTDVEKREARTNLINSKKALPDSKFHGSNESVGIRYMKEEDKRKLEYQAILSDEENEDNDIDDEEEE